jgi:hypothetical protein
LDDLVDLSVVIFLLYTFVAFGFSRLTPQWVEDQPQPHPPNDSRTLRQRAFNHASSIASTSSAKNVMSDFDTASGITERPLIK